MKEDVLLFSEYREALYRALYEDKVEVPNINLFIMWAKKELPNSEVNLGLSIDEFLEAVVKILESNGYNPIKFYEEIENKKFKKIIFSKLKYKDELIKRDLEALEFLKDSSKEELKYFKSFLISLAKDPKNPNQYLAIELLSKLLDDNEVKELYKELLYDWDENVRRAVLNGIKINKDPELVEYVKLFSSEEMDDINLKIIKDILNDG